MVRRRRRKKQNVKNELMFLVAAVTLLAISAIKGNEGFSSHIVLVLLLASLLIAGAILAYVFYADFRRRQAFRLLGLEDIDNMGGVEFEHWVKSQMQARSYKATLTPINDFGVDIIAKKNGIKTAVQVKRYNKVLGQKPVREAVAGMKHYKCSRSMVVTNSRFTKTAKVLAKSNNCELVDREKLAEWIAERQKQ